MIHNTLQFHIKQCILSKHNTAQCYLFYSVAQQRYQSTHTRKFVAPHNPNKQHSTIPDGWAIKIGIEVHAQILTQHKLFSSSQTGLYSNINTIPPNTNVSYIDIGYPGVLPQLNYSCLNQCIATGTALHCNIHHNTNFDRKHYFYPDIPCNYQITQQYQPICTDGHLLLNDGRSTRIDITRIQLEQDSGKNIHDLSKDYTYIDYNRANCALMEIVTTPCIYTAETAVQYVRQLSQLLQHINTCSGRMEDGALRCDVNVSVHSKDGKYNSERVEIKNLNSLRSLHRAIQYETNRQIELYHSNQHVSRETRTYDVINNKTILLRSKEQLLDYRFMNEPDIPPIYIQQHVVQSIQNNLPVLPEQLLDELMDRYQLLQPNALILINELGAAQYFRAVVNYDVTANQCSDTIQRNPVRSANWIINELFGRLRKLADTTNVATRDEYNTNNNTLMSYNNVTVKQMAELIDLIESDQISSKHSKLLLDELVDNSQKQCNNVSVPQLAEQYNYIQISDMVQLQQYVDTVFQQHSNDISDYLNTQNPRMIGLFVGNTVKLSNGKANAKLVHQIVVNQLNKLVQQNRNII